MRRLIFVVGFLAAFFLCQFNVTFARDITPKSNICVCPEVEYVDYFYVGDQLYVITYYDDGSIIIQAVQCTQGD
jgi:hypothetical protein